MLLTLLTLDEKIIIFQIPHPSNCALGSLIIFMILLTKTQTENIMSTVCTWDNLAYSNFPTIYESSFRCKILLQKFLNNKYIKLPFSLKFSGGIKHLKFKVKDFCETV